MVVIDLISINLIKTFINLLKTLNFLFPDPIELVQNPRRHGPAERRRRRVTAATTIQIPIS